LKALRNGSRVTKASMQLSVELRVTFVVDHRKVTVVNSAVFAMKYLQDQRKSEAEKLGLESEQDVNDLMKSIRDED